MLVLRNAAINDMRQYFSWANDELVRQNSISVKVVAWEDHQKWFKNKINDKNSFLFLAESERNLIGQVRFDCENSGAGAVISYSISNDFRGLGLAKKMLKQAIEKISKECPRIEIIKAKIKITNIASNKILIRLGFTEQDKTKQIIDYRLEL